MRGHVGLQSFARPKFLRKRVMNGRTHAAENLIQNGLIQRLFIFEVVIEQRLVDLGGAGNRIGTRSRNALAGEFVDCSFKNRCTAFFRLAAGPEPDCARRMHN